MLKKQNASVLAHVADINVARRGADRILRETPGQTKEPTRNAGGRGAECAGAALVPAVPTTAVALYLRVSTGPQAKRDLSIPDQREALQKFCAARGWNPVAEYVDVGTGTNDLRAGFQEMISALTEGRVKVAMIVVHSFSRFYRDEVEAELYFRSLRRAGVEVVSMTQEVSTDSSGDFVRRIFALFDEHTSRETSKHVRRTLRENARQQFFCGGRPPFGYTSVDAERKRDTIKKRLEIETNEADLVRRIYDLFLRGDGRSGPMGVKAITTYLNGHDVRY
ncbi:recombinase family protein, partial [Cereibacter sphaeroides]